MVASSVARREIPHVAMVTFQECLPEGNGMQLDLGNQNLVRDHRIQRDCIGRQERRGIGEPVLGILRRVNEWNSRRLGRKSCVRCRRRGREARRGSAPYSTGRTLAPPLDWSRFDWSTVRRALDRPERGFPRLVNFRAHPGPIAKVRRAGIQDVDSRQRLDGFCEQCWNCQTKLRL